MIESPCIGVCTIVDGKCIGCFRTSEEVYNWLYYSDKERNKKTKECLKKMNKNLDKGNSSC